MVSEGYYTRRLVYTSPPLRQVIDTEIRNHILAAADLIHPHLPNANLYVAGSLARGEPALRVTSNGFHLRSDIDFVIVGDSGPDTGALEAMLQRAFPDFADTVYFYDRRGLTSLRSFSARDLAEGMAEPILANIPDLQPPQPPLGLAEQMEVVIYQAAGALIATAPAARVHGTLFWHATPEYQQLKALTDLVRVVAHAAGTDGTLHGAFAARHSPRLRSFIHPGLLEELVRRREAAAGEPVPLAREFGALLRIALCRLLVLPYDADVPLILDTARDLLYPDDYVLHRLPIATLKAWLSSNSRDAEFPAGPHQFVLDHRGEYVRQLLERKQRDGSAWHVSAPKAVPT